jgi:hypothetical protein
LNPFRSAVSAAVDFTRHHVISLSHETLLEVACSNSLPLSGSPDIALRLGSYEDVRSFDLARHEYGPAQKQFGYERLDHGDSLIVGEQGGEAVFYAWLMHGQIDLDQRVYVKTLPYVAYSYKVFTVASARGRRICPFYYSFIRRHLSGQGCSSLVCRIGCGNAASIRAHARAGFQPVGHLWQLVLPGCSLFSADTGVLDWLKRSSPSHPFNRLGLMARFCA